MYDTENTQRTRYKGHPQGDGKRCENISYQPEGKENQLQTGGHEAAEDTSPRR